MGRSPVLATATVTVGRPSLMRDVGPRPGCTAPGASAAAPLPAMGSCTVTSLVPSGKVASTCTSGISSATPSITSSVVSSVAPVAHQLGHGPAVARALQDGGA